MTSYTIDMTKDCKKFLKKHDKITRERVMEEIKIIAINPYAYKGDLERLKGKKTIQYRVRIGKYRVTYKLEDEVLVMMLLDMDSRGGIYKGNGS